MSAAHQFTEALPTLTRLAFLATGEREIVESLLEVLADELTEQPPERDEVELRALVVDADCARRQCEAGDDPSVDDLVGRLARLLERRLSPKSQTTMTVLDQLLRVDITSPTDLSTIVPENQRRLEWELKRSCLVRTLQCLSTSMRVAYILTVVLEIPRSRAAAMLGVKVSAYTVRLTRARKLVDAWLEPRCQWIDERNPCSCSGRLPVALARAFVTLPQVDDAPCGWARDRAPERLSETVYRHLPIIQVRDPARARMLRQFEETASHE